MLSNILTDAHTVPGNQKQVEQVRHEHGYQEESHIAARSMKPAKQDHSKQGEEKHEGFSQAQWPACEQRMNKLPPDKAALNTREGRPRWKSEKG